MDDKEFIQSEVSRHECLLADIKAGKVFWCESCECWVPTEEKRQDPWGGDWPMCIDCIADQGLEDNLLDTAVADEEKQHLRSEGE